MRRGILAQWMKKRQGFRSTAYLCGTRTRSPAERVLKLQRVAASTPSKPTRFQRFRKGMPLWLTNLEGRIATRNASVRPQKLKNLCYSTVTVTTTRLDLSSAFTTCHTPLSANVNSQKSCGENASHESKSLEPHPCFVLG